MGPSFETLLDPDIVHHDAVVNLADLRRLAAQGIPDHPPHLRPLTYSLLLGLTPLDKRQWTNAQRNHRSQYRRLAKRQLDILQNLPAFTGSNPSYDNLLVQISRDVLALRQRHPLLDSTTTSQLPTSGQQKPSSLNTPATVSGDDDSLTSLSGYESSDSESSQDQFCARQAEDAGPGRSTRRPTHGGAIIRRLERIIRREEASLAQNSEASPGLTQGTAPSPTITLTAEHSTVPAPIASTIQTPLLSLSAPDDSATRPSNDAVTLFAPRPIPKPISCLWKRSVPHPNTHAEKLCTLLYIFASSNPQWSYHRSITLIAAHLYSVFSEISWETRVQRDRRFIVPVVGNESSEARTHWALCAVVRDFEVVTVGPSIAGPGEITLESTLSTLSRRVKWADEPLWSYLHNSGLAPGSSFYCVEWFTSLMLSAIPASTANLAWDFLLASRSTPATATEAIDAIVDIAAATLIASRSVLLRSREHRSGTKTSSGHGGLWQQSKLSDDNSDKSDEEFLLELLRGPPLGAVSGSTILHIAGHLKDARTIEGISQLRLSVGVEQPAVPGWATWKPLGLSANTSTLASLTDTGSRLTAAAYETMENAVSRMPAIFSTREGGETRTANTWTQGSAHKLVGLCLSDHSKTTPPPNTDTPQQTLIEVKDGLPPMSASSGDTHIAVRPDETRTSPRSPPALRSNLQGPRPLLLSASARKASYRISRSGSPA